MRQTEIVGAKWSKLKENKWSVQSEAVIMADGRNERHENRGVRSKA